MDPGRMGAIQGRKVRVIAKIRSGFTDLESESGSSRTKDRISVQKPNGDESETVTISFEHQSVSQNESYKVDYCYEQNEGNDIIFSREVKPLISGIFDGHDATIVAYGARGSGKTYLIQGSENEPGLAVQAMAEVLSLAVESGKLVSISSYHIINERAYDLLDPKKSEVSVLNDAKGKTQLKGLSQVPVKSILEFQKLYLSGRNLHKSQKKTEPPCRSHKGLVIHVFQGEKSDTIPLGKLNVVDLAGYEDGRRKSTNALNLLENTKINKPIYALQNVVHALNANKSLVPYRESTLTRMLRTSLEGTNQILIVACLSPLFCQDSVHIVSLASRSCLGTSQTVTDSTKRNKSSARLMGHSSLKSSIPGSVSSTVKKQSGSHVQFSERKFSERKANGMASVIKGRKLFTETSHSAKSKKALQKLPMQATSTDIVATIEHPLQEEDNSSLGSEKAIITCDEEPSPLPALGLQETTITDKELSPLAALGLQETAITDKEPSHLAALGLQVPTITDKGVQQSEENHEEVTPSIISGVKALSLVEEGHAIDKENNNSLINESGSPPISECLQELSNNLKLLYSSIPSCVEIPPKNDALNAQFSTDTLEPKTPEPSIQVNEKCELANISSSPWQTFSMRSSGVKNSLVQEYLRFLNTANKEELKKLKGIGEKRATSILELREESPEPFKDLDDLKEIGLSAKQIKGMMKKEMGELFN
ncbi:hypothetical protein SLEP1_g39887 [Rubroshorea leprosula]|uniref:Kinesin motor domain-containing protein n=1 Tax=Rubroshorea leprosula TaxID=152421 RepID=A0AAV5L244_9ROSI|nr:hypothetical protein SLEP1_g39887 [Rubroshorea leprosula]